ncbi:MAG: Spo0E family sporulation regulatory protein-aspartic acid phosphatase [Tissierellaceae bacterium]
MGDNKKVMILKEGIRRKQEELNEIMIAEVDKEKVLKLSQELDKLISFYYTE